MKNISHDQILTRIVSIIIRLHNGEQLYLKELAEEFNVSLRTIQRDFKRLHFLSIDRDRNGAYHLDSHIKDKFNWIHLRDFAIFNGLKSLYPKLDSSTIENILNPYAKLVYLIKNQSFEDTSKQYDKFEDISTAVLKHHILQFSYKDKSRRVKPYKLINIQGIWYLLAEERNVLKHFAFSKITDFKVNWNQSFMPKQEILDKINRNDCKWFANAHIKVTISVAQEAREYFLRKSLLANQVLLSDDNDGLIISTQVAYPDEILNIVKAWIPYIRILEPQDLREKLHAILQDYLKTT